MGTRWEYGSGVYRKHPPWPIPEIAIQGLPDDLKRHLVPGYFVFQKQPDL